MNILDNPKKMKELDKSQMFASIEQLDLQFKQTWSEIKEINLPKTYRNIDHVVLNGMGGSGLAGRLVKTLFSERMSIPIDHIHDYILPRTVNKKTLFFVVSYSGNTEEPVSTVTKGIKRGAKVFIIANGGKLSQIAKKYKLPNYTFKEEHNPCGQPRMGLGYNLGSLVGILKRLNIIDITDAEFLNSLKIMRVLNNKLSVGVPMRRNIAKKIAQKLHGKMPIIIASEHLEGNAHIFRNQINENGKNFANYYLIPELNHHLMEGMINPKIKVKNLIFLFIKSKLYYSSNQKRHEITQKVLSKQGIPWLDHTLIGKSQLEQSFEMLLLGSYASYYLALLNNIDPSPIPWVDYFKDQLSKL